MSLSTKEYFVKETFKSIKRNQLMSFASVSTVAVSLLVLGMFLLMVMNANNLAKYLESQVQISVYMEDSASQNTLTAAEKSLKTMPGVTKVTSITKTQAMAKFKQRLGDQNRLLDALGEENPFPYSFDVQVDKPERIAQIVPKIDEMKGVETAKFGQEVVEHMFKLTKLLRMGGLLLVFLLAMATLFIISNTIRITVFARRREVSIMKYVGATNWFIRWPFLLEGMFLGFAGAMVASLVLIQIYLALQEKVYATLAFFPLITAWPFLAYLSLFLIITGTAIGAAGSCIPLRKFLDV
ncbi:MAG: permease-like cell division protein FtsX [Acidaminococcaceae bacterium]|nr:permease-like cell division protein FtsX [Acidaminococcaceae bacterium]MDD4722999.1 permease-like cell division protein FtsX [Acidaminococcaceae bacterium]